MPFVRDRGHLLKFLDGLQKSTCVYSGPTCDCKYGRDPLGREHQGERTGCPEVRMMLMLVRQLTDDEFSELMCKAGGMFI